MKKLPYIAIAVGLLLLLVVVTCTRPSNEQNVKEDVSLIIRQDEGDSTLSVFREGEKNPIVVQNAKPDFRPYLHPIAAPDGKGVLTEYSPGHHKHQTGLYWGYHSR